MGWDGYESYYAFFPKEFIEEMERKVDKKCEECEKCRDQDLEDWLKSRESTRFDKGCSTCRASWIEEDMTVTRRQKWDYKKETNVPMKNWYRVCGASASKAHFNFTLEKFVSLVKLYPNATMWYYSSGGEWADGFKYTIIFREKDALANTESTEEILRSLLRPSTYIKYSTSNSHSGEETVLSNDNLYREIKDLLNEQVQDLSILFSEN